MSQTVARALALVESVADRPRTLGELADVIGTPKATALRVLQALEEGGFARREGQVYVLGDRVPELVARAGGANSLASGPAPGAEASNRFFSDQFARARVMGIFRGATPERTVELCNLAWDAGVVLVEVPLTGPDSVAALEAAVAAGRERGDVYVGAGTVVRPEQVDAIRRAGAQFTVAPGVHPDAIARSLELGVPHLPGVASSSDIAAALEYGYQWVKAFPAAQLGTDWIKAQHGPFPDVQFVGTGGMGLDNAEAFLHGGCSAIALGSAFADPTSIAGVRAFI